MRTLIAVRQFALGPTGLALGFLAAAAGAALPTGMMAYMTVADDMSFTAISWALIAPAWGGLAILWLAARRWPLFAGLAMAPLAIFAGIYYNDAYAETPAAVLYLLAMAAIFLRFVQVEDARAVDAIPAGGQGTS